MAYLDRGDGTGEALAGLLRAGNAGANTAADHQDVFESALAQLPELPARAQVLVRADSGGSAHAFLAYLADADVRFSVSVRLSEPIKTAIRTLHRHASVWTTAIRQDGEVRDGAHVAEASDLVDLSDYPHGTRLVIRREPLHPGAQQTFDDLVGHRFTAFVTDQNDDDLAVLDARHRGHARVEQRIRDAKDTGLAKLPSADFAINHVWLQLVLTAQRPARLPRRVDPRRRPARRRAQDVRYRLLHVAGRITTTSRRPTLRIDQTWPWAHALVTAFLRIRALPAPV